MFESLKSDDAVSYRLATEEGRLLRLLRANASVTADGAERLRREGDRRANDLLVDRLGRLRPDDAILICRRDLAAPILTALGAAHGVTIGGAP